jgi:uncharacterized membrane protein (UPF0127 family)
MAAFNATNADEAAAMTARKGRFVRILTGDGVEICTRCELADTALSRMRGLLGRRGLDAGGGMLITPCPSVMTFFMRFAIDVVFLDRENTIVGIAHTLRPWRVAGARRAHSALELPAGTAASLRLQEGDLLSIGPV